MRILFPVSIWIFIVGLISCEDVVQVEPDTAPDLLVVDAWINDLPGEQVIRLTTSLPYFDARYAEGVPDAEVEITSENEESFRFSSQGDGNYIYAPANNEVIGQPGDEFELRITWNDQIYQAASTMLPTAPIDSIVQFDRGEGDFGPDGIYTNFFARDLSGAGNTYWIKTFKNGWYLNKPEEINIAFDAGFDAGTEVDGIIFITPIRELTNPVPDDFSSIEDIPSPWAQGDEIRVEIHSITPEAFSFMEIARDQILNGSNTIFAEPLANTAGNIEHVNGDQIVLGIFCVSAVSSMEKTIE